MMLRPISRRSCKVETQSKQGIEQIMAGENSTGGQKRQKEDEIYRKQHTAFFRLEVGYNLTNEHTGATCYLSELQLEV
jgi:hypothetical protein